MRANPSFEAIFHSERIGVFPEHQAKWVFEPHTAEFSMQNAWWLCNLSHLSYYDEDNARPILNQLGLTLEAFIDERQRTDISYSLASDTQAYILSTADYVVLALRGTEPDIYQDILTDAYLHQVHFADKGKVHAGFYYGLSDWCLEKIQHTLNKQAVKDKPLWITGHSLGAALSTIATAYFNPQGLYNFGSPRVGDRQFADTFQNKNVHRFVNCTDIVTRIPLKMGLDYQHIGILHYLDANANHHLTPTDRFVNRDRIIGYIRYPFEQFPVPGLSGKPFFRSLADHSVVSYEYAIWKALNSREG